MRIIALMNQKGGVGKTTTTVNLGAALAEMGKRVLLIDLDPQAHLSINYGVEPDPNICSLYNLLVDGKPMDEAVNQVSDRIWLIPSSIDLAAAEIELVQVHGRETLLKQRLEAYLIAHPEQSFDYVLLDCPPSLGLLTINALSVASEVLIPMQPHFLALQGVAKLLETVQLVSRRMNPKLKVSGIVLTMFDSQTKLSVEVVNELNGFILAALGKPLPWASAKVFDTKIRRNIKLAEAPSFGKPILDYDGASNGAADYRALAREVAGEPKLVTPAPVPKPVVTRAPAPAPRVQKAPAPVAAIAPAAAAPDAARQTAPPTPLVSPAPAPVVVAPPAARVAPAPLRPVPPAPREMPAAAPVRPVAAPAHRTGTAAASHLIAATAHENRRPISPAGLTPRASTAPLRSSNAMPGDAPERTGPLRPVAPLSRTDAARSPAVNRAASPVQVSVNTEIDPAKLAASGIREQTNGLESPDDSEAIA